MSDWLGALIGGTLQGGFGLLSSATQYNQQKKLDSKAYKRQVALLQMQQAWAERMANTAHQREVKDLRAAGLNPILSATGGNGAMTPAVSASGVATGSTAPGLGDAPGFDMDVLNSASTIGLNRAIAAKADADAKLAKEKIKTERVTQNDIEARTMKTFAETDALGHRMEGEQLKGDAAKTIRNIFHQAGDLFSSARSRKETVKGLKETFLQDPMTFISPGGKLLKEAYHGLTGQIPVTPGSRIRDGVKRLKRGAGKFIWNTIFKKKRK